MKKLLLRKVATVQYLKAPNSPRMRERWAYPRKRVRLLSEDRNAREYEKHRIEVDNLTQRIEEANWGEITTKNYAILNNVIDRYEEDLIQRKNRKFRRDLYDYQHGRVYTFSKKYDNIQDPNNSMNISTGYDTPLSSEPESSDDSTSCSTTRPQVHFLEEARRYRLGTLKELRTATPDTSIAVPSTSGIQTRARSKTTQP
ncbi:hypothetical protein NDU88_006226 [Pleurodeles waltl]|uniref:Uncharacterized protein n=1 Tax=Pleurodeles waltl TaxID=8319 RepID=A0AAV7PMV0_PLEWA|nr:hypothetical protein NDU88_006226 [Pleurodeles waltl]